MFNIKDIGFEKATENVNGEEIRIKSTEVVELVNEFRALEDEVTGNKQATLKHDDFMKKIERELEVLETMNISLGNISESEYINSRGRKYPCYSLNRDGMLQMLNSESALVRAKTIEYINKLEEELKKPKRLSPKEELRLHYQALEEQSEEIADIKNEVSDLKENMPLFNIDCEEIQGVVRKIGIKVLGGYKSTAYDDNSIRGKVYADIQNQLKREFGVRSFKAIKRSQLEQAMDIVRNYKAPLILQERIRIANKQMKLIEGGM